MSRQTEAAAKGETEKKKEAAPGGAAFTYILKCADGSFYTGWTNDLERRLRAHNAGTGSKYTRSRRPVELLYYEEFPDKESAMRREAEIKSLSRAEKETLILHSAPSADRRGS